MRVTCTHCSTSYNVDLSEVKPQGIEFKCAKCKNFFLIKSNDITKPTTQVAKNYMKNESNKFSDDANLNTLLTSVIEDVTSYGNKLNNQISKLSDIGNDLSGATDISVLGNDRRSGKRFHKR